MIAKLIIGSTTTDFAMSAFLTGIIAVGSLSFFGVKAYLFNNDRNIELSQVYIDKYTSRQRSFFSSAVLFVIITTPFILMFFVWLSDKPLPNWKVLHYLKFSIRCSLFFILSQTTSAPNSPRQTQRRYYSLPIRQGLHSGCYRVAIYLKAGACGQKQNSRNAGFLKLQESMLPAIPVDAGFWQYL